VEERSDRKNPIPGVRILFFGPTNIERSGGRGRETKEIGYRPTPFEPPQPDATIGLMNGGAISRIVAGNCTNFDNLQ